MDMTDNRRYVKKAFFNHILIFDKGNYPHRALAPGTYEGINLIDLLYQPRPVSAKFLRALLRLQDIWYLLVYLSFLAAAPTCVAEPLVNPLENPHLVWYP
jgi:hypothetical protein